MPTREDQVALRKGCDLVNIGATKTPATFTHSLSSMLTPTQGQDDKALKALTDEELEAANGGISMIPIVVPIIVDLLFAKKR